MYGKKLKIKIVTKEVTDGTKIEFGVKGKSKNDSQEFWKIDELKWNLEIQSNTCETDLFSLNTLWYSEEHEYYDYDSHKTKIKAEDLNTYTIKGILNFQTFELLNEQDELKPIAYLRNYEELIGLFNADNSGEKALIDNYENKFISDKPEVFKISREFSGYLNFTENLTLNDIKERVKTDAKKLWDAAVQVVQAGILDDRPLYWARNKMQVRLKRNPIFENDINFETSIVKDGSELYKLIQLFEEQSRNYNGIDFSKANGKKKVLITGFDPFILNEFDNDYLKKVKANPNILQSNPSGVVALALANYNLGAYIQTMLVPVRYTDFDGSEKNNEGQGVGIIERYIKPYINQVDMIITVSQYKPDENVIDMFGTATRGGFNDNQNFLRIEGSHALAINDEWIETTLPIEFTNAPSIEYNWEFNEIPNLNKVKPLFGQKLNQGSGGDYLSNEIFYRVAKMRKEMRPALKTGHFHISKIQEKSNDLDSKKIFDLLNVVKKGIEEGIKGI